MKLYDYVRYELMASNLLFFIHLLLLLVMNSQPIRFLIALHVQQYQGTASSSHIYTRGTFVYLKDRTAKMTF